MRKKSILILLLIPALCLQGAGSRHRYKKIQKRIVIKPEKPRIVKGELADTIWQFATNQNIVTLQSSSLQPKKYDVRKLFDRNFSTCWAEGGKGFGRGDWVMFGLLEQTLWIYNGMWRSKALFYANNRVKKMKISFYQVYKRLSRSYDPVSRQYKTKTTFFKNVYLMSETVVELPDGMYPIEIYKEYGRLRFEVTKPIGATGFSPLSFRPLCRLEILDVYPGTKYNDTCVTEIIRGGFHVLGRWGNEFVY